MEQSYYCKECGQYLPSGPCSFHGSPHSVRVGDEPARRPAHQTAAHTAHQPAPAVSEVAPTLIRFDSDPSKDGAILRFRKTERWLHWAIAVPFMVCWVSALILVLVYNPEPLRPNRLLFSWLHRIAGAGLIAFPLFVLFKSRAEYRVHAANIKTAWRWSLNDMKWLALMGLAAISKKITLPEQGKFNAAEKVNFMIVMLSSPIFVLTGLMMWIQDGAWVPWLIHGFAALLVTPTMLGHIYMATVNPDTRSGISGMVSGYVEREWAKHHYALWYREHFENNLLPAKDMSMIKPQPDRRIHIHCPACSKDMTTSWSWLLQRVFALRAIRCPGCGATFAAITAITDQHQLRWIKLQFDMESLQEGLGGGIEGAKGGSS